MQFAASTLMFSHYVIMGVGVYACWRAYRHRRSRAWLLLAVYCLSPFLICGLRATGRAFHGPVPSKGVVQQDEQLTGDRDVPERRIALRPPLFPLVLAIALWALAKKELEGEVIEPIPQD